MASNPTPDERAARLASRNHGLLTRAQAHRCGLTDRQIGRRTQTGRWMRCAPGVYRIAGAPVTGHQGALAAVLAAGATAVASHLTAAGLLGLVELPPVHHITVAPSASSRTRGVVVHRSLLAEADLTIAGVIPCTAPARTLLDIAGVVPAHQLNTVVDEALCMPLCSPTAVLDTLERSQRRPGRSGTASLRESLAPWLQGVRPGSPAEVRLLRRLAEWGLPAPVCQHEVQLGAGGRRRMAVIDLAWPDRLVGLEYDGERHHGPRQLGADVEREERLRGLGWWIGRVDRHDLRPSARRLRDELTARLLVPAA
jgi:hypothetical protein